MKLPSKTPVSRRLFLGGIAAASSTAVVQQASATQPNQRSARPRQAGSDMMRHWNSTTIDAIGLDHTPVAAGEDRIGGQQLGPGRSSWAAAIVHIAAFEAVNAITGRYHSYAGLAPGPREASIDVAIAQASHDALNFVLSGQSKHCDQLLAADLAAIPNGPLKVNGIDIGRRAAAAAIALRAKDGTDYIEPRVGVDFLTSDQPGKWRQDPISRIPVALGAQWGEVRPFVLDSADQFRTPPPAALTSRRYRVAFDEAKRLGGDGIVTRTERTADQTVTGIFWAYDGTPSLCAPPRLYNQIAMRIADEMGTSADPVETARLLALVNVAMADAGIAIWESKYFYQYWRPVTGIREADDGAGPSGLGDGNPATRGDATFTPLGAPASNLAGPNFTPPFPAYPSGHAGFGGALFQTLRRFYGTDNIPFTFVSDEYNGLTKASDGTVRPRIERTYQTLSQAEEENGQSRIYLGIHWSFDKTEGIHQGRRVADYVFDNAFLVKTD